MPELHSKYSASAAARWMGCPGSMVLEVGKPNSSSIYSAGGTCEHTVAEDCLTNETVPSAFVGRIYQVDGFDIEFDEERAGHVTTYVDNIRAYGKHADAVMIEVKVNYAKTIGVPESDGWGTADAVILHGSEIQVHDYKGGRGEEVYPENNPQMSLYGLGALEAYDGLAGDFTHVRMVIHQPRVSKAPKEWLCTVEELRAFGATAKLKAFAVKAAEHCTEAGGERFAEKYLVPGEKQCRWCKAKATCPALRAEVAKSVTLDQAPATPDEFAAIVAEPPAEQDAEWLAAAMGKANLIEGFISEVRAEVERRLLAGAPVPGYKLVQGKQGNRAWNNKAEAEQALKSMRLKQDEMYTFSLISPTAAEKLLKDVSPRRWTSLQAFIGRSPGSPSVAPVSDKRPALEIGPVADDFAEVHAFDDLA